MNNLRISFLISICIFSVSLGVIFYMTFAVDIPNYKAIITIQDKIISTQNDTINILKDIVILKQSIIDNLEEELENQSEVNYPIDLGNGWYRTHDCRWMYENNCYEISQEALEQGFDSCTYGGYGHYNERGVCVSNSTQQSNSSVKENGK